MALTGIQIFKILPKTNCKECGVPTCLAFAMNLASGKAELDACPYVSDEAREQLAEASAPPILPVQIGKGVRKFTVGAETVLYRHEKTFYNPTALAVKISSDIKEKDLVQIRKSISENEEPVIVSDKNRLRQVFTNLLSYAVKFTPEGFV